MDLNTAFSGKISQQGNNENSDFNTTIRGTQKMGEDVSNQVMDERIKKMREDRDADLKSLTGNKPPLGF